jgi:F-type H+-transporting ATPase subunit delta
LSDRTVAARYAKALFIVTERRKETVAALADLLGVGVMLAPDSRLARFFASPEVRLSDKRELLRRALEKRAVRAVGAFMDLLLLKKRLRDLRAIVTAFEALVESSQGIQRAHLVSAVPFDRAELARLQERLEAHTHARIKLSTEVDAQLIGGAHVRIGDRVIDRSVRTLLGAIAARLHETSV